MGDAAASSLSYELANSYVMKKEVLLPDLRTAVEDPSKFFLWKELVSVPIITSVDDASATNTLQWFTSPAYAMENVVRPPTSGAVTAVMSTIMTLNVTDTTINGIVNRVGLMCLALVDTQLRKGFGSGFRIDSLLSYVSKQFMAMLVEIQKVVPFPKSVSDTSPVSLGEHLENIRGMMDTYVNSKIQPDMREWLFTPALINIFYGCMQPYFRMQYIASLVRGEWNKAGNLNNVTFYDARYAELVLYRGIMALYADLAAISQDVSYIDALELAAASTLYRPEAISAADLITTIQGLSDGYKNTLQLKLNATQDTLMDAHGDVALISNITKYFSVGLNQANNNFEFRRQTLKSLAMAVAPMKAKQKTMQQAFYMWVAAYVTIVISSILLMTTNRFNTFFLLAIMSLLIVTLYSLVRVIIAYVRNITRR